MLPRILDIEPERVGYDTGTEGIVDHLLLVLGNLPLGRVLGSLPPSSHLVLFVLSWVLVHVQGRRHAWGESLAGSRSRCREAHVLGLACSSTTYAFFLFTPTMTAESLAKTSSPVWEDLAHGETLT